MTRLASADNGNLESHIDHNNIPTESMPQIHIDLSEYPNIVSITDAASDKPYGSIR